MYEISMNEIVHARLNGKSVVWNVTVVDTITVSAAALYRVKDGFACRGKHALF